MDKDLQKSQQSLTPSHTNSHHGDVIKVRLSHLFICYFSDSPFGIIFIDVRNAFIFNQPKIGCGPSTEMCVRWTVAMACVPCVYVRETDTLWPTGMRWRLSGSFFFLYFYFSSVLFTCVCHQPDTNRENKCDKWYPTRTFLPLRNMKIIHVWSCDDVKSRPRQSISRGEWNLRIHRYFESAFWIEESVVFRVNWILFYLYCFLFC